MFERWRTFELTPDGYRETVIGIGDTLRKLGVSDKEAEAGKQLVEHIYSLQLSRRPEVCDKVKVRKRFGDISLRLETKGDEYNPLQMLEEWNEDDPDYERTVFLKSKKEQLSYAHPRGGEQADPLHPVRHGAGHSGRGGAEEHGVPGDDRDAEQECGHQHPDHVPEFPQYDDRPGCVLFHHCGPDQHIQCVRYRAHRRQAGGNLHVYHGYRHDSQYYHRPVHVPRRRAPDGNYQRQRRRGQRVPAGYDCKSSAGEPDCAHCEPGYAAGHLRFRAVRRHHQYAGRDGAAAEGLYGNRQHVLPAGHHPAGAVYPPHCVPFHDGADVYRGRGFPVAAG